MKRLDKGWYGDLYREEYVHETGLAFQRHYIEAISRLLQEKPIESVERLRKCMGLPAVSLRWFRRASDTTNE